MHYISVSYFRRERERGGTEIEKDQWLWWLYPVSALSTVLKQQRHYLWKQSRPKGPRDKPALCSTLNEAYSSLPGSAGGEDQSSETPPHPLDSNTIHSDLFTKLGHRADEETTLTLWHLIQTHQITGPRLSTFQTVLHLRFLVVTAWIAGLRTCAKNPDTISGGQTWILSWTLWQFTT